MLTDALTDAIRIRRLPPEHAAEPLPPAFRYVDGKPAAVELTTSVGQIAGSIRQQGQ
jgi:hypothetical protein